MNLDPDQLINTSETLSALFQRFVDLPEHRDDAMQAALCCVQASLIVSELAHHLVHGVEPYEALRRTAVGELAIPPAKATMFALLATISKNRAAR